MKRALLAAVITLVVLLAIARRASAEPPRAVVVLDASEAADTWLHEHCSYRGVYVATAPIANPPGTIATLVESSGSRWTWGEPQRTAKVFRCGEKPSFWTAPFEPAPPAAVACTDARESTICVPPLRPKPKEPIDRWLPPSQPQPPMPPLPASPKVDLKTAAIAVTAATPTTSTMVHIQRTRAGDALAPTIPAKTTSTPRTKKAKERRT